MQENCKISISMSYNLNCNAPQKTTFKYIHIKNRESTVLVASYLLALSIHYTTQG